jgi:hypothetical protein
MGKKAVCVAVEVIGELAMGLAIGTLNAKHVAPKLTKAERVIVDIGTLPACWMLGRAWGKTWFKFCDEVLGTDFNISNKM